MHQQFKKMSLIGLILMIFTSVFGFANSPSAFYLMGYSAMPFYLFPPSFLYSVRADDGGDGSAYRREEGGSILDEPQRRAALCFHRHLYVVCVVRGVDGEYGG